MRISDWSSDVCSSDLIELADNDAAALAIAAQRTVDVAVVDLRAPGVNGPALLAAIRQRYPEVVRLLLIDDAQQDDAMRVLDRSEERRVGKECVRTCISRVSPDP